MIADWCELYGILSALRYVRSTQLSKVIIISAFRLSLSSLKDKFSITNSHPIIFKIVKIVFGLIVEGSIVQFFGFPSHRGICGNERADKLAKGAFKVPIENFFGAPVRDIFTLL